jgi:hypothetical protein
MSNAQKNYLKKWATTLGIILSIVLIVTFIALGDPWHWISLGIAVLALVAIVVGFIATAIASLIWHWRLMGVCENEWEEHMLKKWGRYMNYWGGCWEDLIPRWIAEDYEQNTQDYVLRMELYDKFRAVKVPRVLRW